MLKKAWGLPSLKQAKQASLFFNRFVKGASVSDKITIANVPCFILSKHPVPELAELRNQPTQRSQNLSQMSTIAEEEEIASHSGFEFSKTFGKRDVILHLTGRFAIAGVDAIGATTIAVRRCLSQFIFFDFLYSTTISFRPGGGFFAHTIASDLPYLLDWSETTNSVVIAPEYALLPETFPTALNQIIDIYQALVGGPDKESALPFEIDKICVTGESAGGNLAAALCVHLIQENHKNLTRTNPIPDCMMLSCPALDLSTESSPSRIRGREDPVLPNGLLTVIRDSYTGHHDKNDPLCSPIQASDEVLCDWCPLLMFVGSDDPLLDDAVAFNDRLQQCGVESEIRAATNVPHAYLGLATAGFPEAVEQHEYAMRWLRDIFSKTEHR
jgi:acetyl esterase/lipase